MSEVLGKPIEWIPVEDLIEKLGWGRSTVNKWIHQNYLTTYWIKGKKCVEKECFETFIKRHHCVQRKKSKKSVLNQPKPQVVKTTTKVVEENPTPQPTSSSLKELIDKNRNTHRFTPDEFMALLKAQKIIDNTKEEN